MCLFITHSHKLSQWTSSLCAFILQPHAKTRHACSRDVAQTLGLARIKRPTPPTAAAPMQPPVPLQGGRVTQPQHSPAQNLGRSKACGPRYAERMCAPVPLQGRRTRRHSRGFTPTHISRAARRGEARSGCDARAGVARR